MIPTLLLGGDLNTLAVARRFGRLGIPVYVAAKESCPTRHSRFAAGAYYPQPGESLSELWRRLLLVDRPSCLDGAVVIACDDEAIAFLSDRANDLLADYRLEENQPALRFKLLDKLATLELAEKAGVPTPQYWRLDFSRNLADQTPADLEFPVLIKPIYTYVYKRIFGRKLTLVYDNDMLHKHLGELEQHQLEAMVCEFVPGPDDLLCSHYTYVDESGSAIFSYTKRVLRRLPKNFGGGTYHISEVLPDVAEVGWRFFSGIGLRGLGNVEFKRDLRDNQLKIIECNPRITAAHQLLIDSDMDVAKLIYDRLTGAPVGTYEQSRRLKRLVQLRPDYFAYKELKKKGELTTVEWLKSVVVPHKSPLFQWQDPAPGVHKTLAKLMSKLRAPESS